MKPVIALVMTLTLSACSLPVFFRVPVEQGNIVTSEQITQIEEGMTKKQVAYVLGTPMIASPFAENRWDYVFYYRNPHAHVRQSKLTLHFVEGRLDEVEGNDERATQAIEKVREKHEGPQTEPADPTASEASSDTEDPLSDIPDRSELDSQDQEQEEVRDEEDSPDQPGEEPGGAGGAGPAGPQDGGGGPGGGGAPGGGPGM